MLVAALLKLERFSISFGMQMRNLVWGLLLLPFTASADLLEKTVTTQKTDGSEMTITRTKEIQGDWVREELVFTRKSGTIQSALLYNLVTRERYKMRDGKWTAEGRGAEKVAKEEVEKRLEKEKVLAAQRPQFTRTMEHQTINGYECDKYVCETDRHTTTAWVAPALSKYLPIHSRAHDPDYRRISMQLPDYSTLPGIAVRIIGITRMPPLPGQLPVVATTTSDLVTISEEPLAPSRFAPPAEE